MCSVSAEVHLFGIQGPDCYILEMSRYIKNIAIYRRYQYIGIISILALQISFFLYIRIVLVTTEVISE